MIITLTHFESGKTYRVKVKDSQNDIINSIYIAYEANVPLTFDSLDDGVTIFPPSFYNGAIIRIMEE